MTSFCEKKIKTENIRFRNRDNFSVYGKKGENIICINFGVRSSTQIATWNLSYFFLDQIREPFIFCAKYGYGYLYLG